MMVDPKLRKNEGAVNELAPTKGLERNARVDQGT